MMVYPVQTYYDYFSMIMGGELDQSADVSTNDSIQMGSAIDALYPKVYRTVAGLTAGSGLDVDDLTQDTFLKAYRNLHRFRGDSSLYTWIYKIARNVCLDALRRKKIRNRFHFDWFQNENAGSDFPDPHVHDAPENSDLKYWIDKAMAKLPEDFRSIIVFREIQELSYEEIAFILEIPVGTVKSRLFNARRLMRDYLIQYGVQP